VPFLRDDLTANDETKDSYTLDDYNISHRSSNSHCFQFFYTGQSVTNQELEDQAHMTLANSLLDDYLQSKDSHLPDEVVKISNGHNLRYPNRRYKMMVVDIDSLIKNRDTILDTTIWIIDPN
jgi:hypothetical protein